MKKKDVHRIPPWFKVYSRKVLTGSIRFDLLPEERSVWYDLLALANESPVRGIICASKGVPFPHEFLAGTLNISLKLLESTFAKCQEEGRISEDGRGIHITNWKAYQATYEKRKEAPEQPSLLEPTEELSSERLARQAELDSRLPKRELKKLSPERQEAAKAYREDPDKFIKGKYGHMVRR